MAYFQRFQGARRPLTLPLEVFVRMTRWGSYWKFNDCTAFRLVYVFSLPILFTYNCRELFVKKRLTLSIINSLRNIWESWSSTKNRACSWASLKNSLRPQFSESCFTVSVVRLNPRGFFYPWRFCEFVLMSRASHGCYAGLGFYAMFTTPYYTGMAPAIPVVVVQQNG